MKFSQVCTAHMSKFNIKMFRSVFILLFQNRFFVYYKRLKVENVIISIGKRI